MKRALPDCTPPPPFEFPGVFETCRVKGGRILHLKEHLLRLAASLKTLRLDPFNLKELQGLEASAREVRDGFVRIAVSGSKTPRVLIHRHPGLPYPKPLYRRGISIHTAAGREPHPEAVPSGAKCSERLSSVLARWEWVGDREVLRLGASGFLTEGTASNLFLIQRGVVYTPPAWLGVLEGVTRALVLKAAHRLGLAALEVPVTRHELFNAEEAFLTNVLMGILPLRSVDGRAIGARVPGPVTRRLTREIESSSRKRGSDSRFRGND